MFSPLISFLTAGIIIILFALAWILLHAATNSRGMRIAAKLFWAFLLWNGFFLATLFILGAEVDRRGKVDDMVDHLYLAVLSVYAWMFYISPLLLLLLCIWYFIARAQNTKPKQQHHHS